MTPQAKAKELFDRFYPYMDYEIGHIQQKRENAKYCALIAVDEIIIQLEQLRKPEYTTFIISYEKEETLDGYEKIEYWQSVKNHIQSL